MAEIKAADVAQLRKMTNAGLMQCKKALQESGGDLDAAVEILRKKGEASAAKKADRQANEGIIAQAVTADGKSGILVEVNCETDFVAKNDMFQAFTREIAEKLLENPDADLEADRTTAVSKIGENIVIARSQALAVEGSGMIATYIHTGGKVGVMVAVTASEAGTTEKPEFQQLCRDLTLQVAASAPIALTRDEVDSSIIDKEIEILREQMKDKPAAALENIIRGKMEKYYQGVCLIDQGFVKDPDVTIGDYVKKVAKDLGDSGISIQKYYRFEVGGA
jgi:elongation factor Ts